jgi:hypothetical protein
LVNKRELAFAPTATKVRRGKGIFGGQRGGKPCPQNRSANISAKKEATDVARIVRCMPPLAATSLGDGVV